jgi:hypothetical protein
MALAGIALLAALWGGLVRLGWRLPPLQAAFHGPLIISGFLGTLVSLERAAALGRRWPYLASLLAGLGGLALLTGLPPALGRGLVTLGSLTLVAIFGLANRLQPNAAHLTMGLGALCWLIGNIAWWAGQPLYQAVPWWAGFLVLTIAGERLELARLLRPGRWAQITFVAGVGLFTLGLLTSRLAFGIGVRVSGAGLIALGLWLLRYDIARRTIWQTGLARYIAACLLPGYVWLIAAGGLWLAWGDYFLAGPMYDARLHALFVGFVLSMIFGHAPIIFPALVGSALSYRPWFYLPLSLLHASLLLRVAGGLSFTQPLRLWGGMLNVVALLLFAGLMVGSARGGRA